MAFLANWKRCWCASCCCINSTRTVSIKESCYFLRPMARCDRGWMAGNSEFICHSVLGGLFGAGLGESKQKFLYIPEPHNDFIFSILGEELGFIGCAAVLILFAIFIWRGVLIAMRAPDMFGSLLAIGITALVAIQVIINVAVVTSSMPATGMPLPFFSYRWNCLIYPIV